MLKLCAKDETFSAMLRKCAPSFRLVVHERLHTNGYKRCRVVIVWPVDISVSRDLGVHIGLSEYQ